ncbi:MAG: MerR family transcriptional regulator [Lachnospiraceae bacterium]
MKISEVEELVGITKANIRYYESEGLISPAYLQNGYRDYSGENVEALKKIRFLRELGFGIEQIRECINGTRTLFELAEERYRGLEVESAQISQARNVCERLCKERITFDSLQPDEFKNCTTEKENQKETEAVKNDIESPVAPIRRFLARSMDMAIIGAAINAVLQFGFRLNMAKYAALASIVFSLAVMLVMYLVEPLLLHIFGTTPGKAMLGLHLEGHDGELPELESARAWTGGVILSGMGLNMPVLSLIRMFLSWRRASKDEFLSWECLDYRLKKSEKGKRIGVIIYILTGVLLIGVGAAGFNYMCTPPNRGKLTVEQYAENYNVLYGVYLNKNTLVPKLNSDGAFEEVHTEGVVIDVTGGSSGNMKRRISYELDGEYISKIVVRIEGRNLFYYDYMDECVQLVTLTALLSEEGSDSVFGARNRMEEIISCIKNINSYTSDRLSVEAVVTCSGMTVIDGTVLRGDSGSDNSCEIVYTIELK